MNKGDKLYINVGGKGLSSNSSTNGILLGGYNGGGNAYVIASSCSNAAGSGGGATHISLASGLLSSFETKIDNILIVAAGGGGGSSYIGNSLLTDKVMYCYNCEESTEESTKTISTTNVSEEAISNYVKQGNGYAKITYLGEL